MKLLLLSHGHFASGLLDSYRMIAGENPNISTITLQDDGIHNFSMKLHAYITSLKEESVLILTDIQGGTPFNEAYGRYLQHSQNIRLLSGMNLPMVIEVGLQLPHKDLDTLYQLAIDTGRTSIIGVDLKTEEEEMEW